MAKLIRQDGDYTYWSDGAQRYAKGNSLGKAPGSLAKRHPKAALPITELPPDKQVEVRRNGGLKRWEKAQEKVRQGWQREAAARDPEYKASGDEVAFLAESMAATATSGEGGGASVRAADWLMKHSGYEQTAGPSVDARQIHITVTPDSGGELARFAQRLIQDTVDGEVREVDRGSGSEREAGE